MNLRTAASPSASLKVKLSLSSTVTVSGTVAGRAWKTSCPTAKSGSSWYVVTHVNGQAIRARYGVARLYVATGVLRAPAGGTATTTTAGSVAIATPAEPSAAGSSFAPACDGVSLRASASTTGELKATLGPSTSVTVAATMTGPSWSAVCPISTTGSSWYVVTKVDETPVDVLYGVPFLYAATGVLVPRAASISNAPATPAAQTPAPTVAPATSAPPDQSTVVPAAPDATTDTVLAAACDGVNLRTSASTSGAVKVKLALGSTVSVSGSTAGSAWSSSCPTPKSDSTWYVVSAVNGQTVSALYGVAALYAATGVLTAPGAAAPDPAPAPAVGAPALDPTATTF